MRRDHRITQWNPEDTAAWEDGDREIARRNLLCTMAGDHVAFSIWSLWSVMALFGGCVGGQCVSNCGVTRRKSADRTQVIWLGQTLRH